MSQVHGKDGGEVASSFLSDRAGSGLVTRWMKPCPSSGGRAAGRLLGIKKQPGPIRGSGTTTLRPPVDDLACYEGKRGLNPLDGRVQTEQDTSQW